MGAYGNMWVHAPRYCHRHLGRRAVETTLGVAIYLYSPMTTSLKQAIENHPIVVYSSAVVFAFASGWGAHWTVQIASGQTVVPAHRLKQLELLEKEISELKTQKGRSAPSSENPEKPSRAPLSNPTRAATSKSSAEGAASSPPSKDKPWITLGTMYLEGFSGKFRAGHKFTVSFDYFVEPGSLVNVQINPDMGAGRDFYWEPGSAMTGAGRFSRYFVVNSPGTIEKINVMAIRGNEVMLLKEIPIKLVIE